MEDDERKADGPEECKEYETREAKNAGGYMIQGSKNKSRS
jgi:hypothetical protein